MPFNGAGSNISGAGDVFLSSTANNDLLKYNGSTSKWNNALITKGDIGLANVDNTSDANKPVSTATQTALDGKAATSHTHDDRYYTEAETDAQIQSATSNVSVQGHSHTTTDISNLEQWRIDSRIAKIQTYDSSLSQSPGTVGNCVLWLDLASTPTSSPAITYVTHQQDTANAASWTFTPENLLSAFSDHDYFVAFVWTANATTMPANDVDTLTGGGMTWSAIGTPASSSSGILTLSAFRSTAGTPDGTNLVAGATGGTEGCSIEVVAVRDLPYDDTFLSGAGSLNTATLAVTGATANQRVIAAIGWNSGSQTITADPGTALGGTPDVTMATPSLKTRASVINPAATSIQWTKSGNSQQVYGGVLVGTP